MVVHSALSSFIAGHGYEDGTLRVVIKDKDVLKAYDYIGVTAEEYSDFVHGLGKSLSSIKKKYPCKPVTDITYSLDPW